MLLSATTPSAVLSLPEVLLYRASAKAS